MSLQAAIRFEEEANWLARQAHACYSLGTARFNENRGVRPELARDGLDLQAEATVMGRQVASLRRRAAELLDDAIRAEERATEFMEHIAPALRDPAPRSHDGGTFRTRRGGRVRQRR